MFYYTVYSLILRSKDLFGNAKPKHTQKHETYVQCLKVDVKKNESGSELSRYHAHWMTNMRFRPLPYYSLCQVYSTLRAIKKHPIADYCPYVLRTLFEN